MAVTIGINDLKQPTGKLSEKLFDDEFDVLLGGWLQQAVEQVEANTGIVSASQNKAAAAWVYHLAFEYKAALQANTPNQVNFTNSPGISKTMSADQREYFVNQSKYWLGIYTGYDTTPVATTGNVFAGSLTVPVLPRW